jgi:glutaredoxin
MSASEREPSTSAELVVTLYTRPGCHLCDEAREAILNVRAAGLGFELREVDIEGDERLHAEYLERIPVVEVEGEIVSELVLDVHALRSRLHTVAA